MGYAFGVGGDRVSLDPILWAMKDAPVADVEEFAVLVAMAESGDEDGCNAFQSVATIARRTKLHERTVQRRMDAMRDRGLIVLGDQQYPLLLSIPADRRPTNYDLMIPYSWWGTKWERMNDWRTDRRRPALQPEDRPDLSAPPVPKRRADHGVKRPKQDGVTTSHPVDGVTASHPVTGSPARGDSQSGDGVTTSHPTHPSLNPPQEPTPTPSTAVAIAPTGRLTATVVDSTGTTSQEIDLLGLVERTPAGPGTGVGFLGQPEEPEPDEVDEVDAEKRRTVRTLVAAYVDVVAARGGHCTGSLLDSIGKNVKRVVHNDKIPEPVLLVAVQKAASKGLRSIDGVLAATDSPQVSWDRSPAARRAMHESWLAMGRKLDEAAARRAAGAA